MKLFLALILSMLVTFGLAAEKKQEIVLTNDNVAVFLDVVDGASTGRLMQELQKMDSTLPSGYPIYVFMYTPGGNIQDGLELIEYVSTINRPIHTITLFSASMGFQMVQNFGKRYILEYGTLMSHKAKGGFEGEFGGGLSQLDSRYNLWLKKIDSMDRQTVKRTNGKQTLQSYRAAYANELWMDGFEAVKKGYADAVVTVKCDKTLNGTREILLKKRSIEITVVLSACPLNLNPIDTLVKMPTTDGMMELTQFLGKGGKFNCGEYDRGLCSTVQGLTLEILEDMVTKAKLQYSKSSKDKVIYSY